MNAITDLWQSLLLLRRRVSDASAFIPVEFKIKGSTKHEEFNIHVSDKPDHPGFMWNGEYLEPFQLEIDADPVRFLKLYLPLCYASLRADRLKRAFCSIHLAQTLDGKIATHTGSSKWIGNKENLIHAHRMRALHDAVAVGKRTYQVDNPALTVRHVTGPNPSRIVIWGNHSPIKPDGQTLYLTSNEEYDPESTIQLPSADGKLSCEDILKTLYNKGIKSVYLEGGSYTASRFIESGLVDNLQLHFSNKILGSGLAGVQLPLVDTINKSIHLQNVVHYTIGDELMIVGNVG